MCTAGLPPNREIRENLGILFSISENEGRKKDFVTNQGRRSRMSLKISGNTREFFPEMLVATLHCLIKGNMIEHCRHSWPNVGFPGTEDRE